MVIVFDLDDTLYEELSYVKSGFLAVARYLQETYHTPAETCFDSMSQKLESGRG